MLGTGSKLRCSALTKCGLERYIGEGGFDERELGTQRLSYGAFFGYFLVRRQESNIDTSLDKVVSCKVECI